jgi:DNA-binding NtrC family response regulator
MNVLIVDDQRSARHILTSVLGTFPGLSLHEAGSLDEARQALTQHAIDVAFIDIRLNADARNRDGFTLVREVREKTNAIPIVVTAYNQMGDIRTAMRLGAYDYILKDELCEELVAPVIDALRDKQRLEREVLELRARRVPTEMPDGLVGASAAMDRLRAAIRRVAVSDRPVLVLGATGSGKEVVVRTIHALGAHPEEPLLDINCGAIPETLMESLLFGHERGAFSGADRRQEGFFTAVRRGTLFLDEIGELPLSLQAKLLRVLESVRYRSLGATVEQRFAGRIVVATHRDLEQLVAAGRFREDLFYRLNVLVVRVPALEDRRDDIPLLVAHFVKQQSRPLRFSPEALEVLARSSWPGNVRQLRNVVDRLAVFAEDDWVTPEALADLGEGRTGAQPAEGSLDALARAILRLSMPNKLAAVEGALVAQALVMTGGNKSAAARLLGLHRKSLERRVDSPGEPESEH